MFLSPVIGWIHVVLLISWVYLCVMRTPLSPSHHQDDMAEEARGKTCASVLTLLIWSFLPLSRLPRLDFRLLYILLCGVLPDYGRSVSIFRTLSKCMGPLPAKSKTPRSLLLTYALFRYYSHLRSMWLAFVCEVSICSYLLCPNICWYQVFWNK